MQPSYEQIIQTLLSEKHQETFFINIGGKKLRLTINEVDEIEPPRVDNKTIDPLTTIVTGLWNLGRDQLTDGFSRSYDQYKEKFAELLKCPNNMFIYISKDDEEFVWQHRSRHNTFVKVMELDEFQTWFEFYDAVQTIRNTPEWVAQAEWLHHSPQANLEYYNPVVMGKMFLLNDASLFNPFGSEYFYWIDAGITNTVHPGYFSHDCVFNNLPSYTDAMNSLVFISYPYIGGEEIHGFPRNSMAKYCNTSYVNYVCRGGFFGGKKTDIQQITPLYHGILSSSLNEQLMGTEESIFTILAHRYPEWIYHVSVEDNGLVWPFFEKLKDVRAFIESQPKKLTARNATNNVYVLSFNSPQQFESVCTSIQLNDIELFTRSRKILINNSTNAALFDDYARLCTEYGFEEIRRENLGVCGGRQFAAEHFDESDADFYMFFEDDMHLNAPNTQGETCSSGFKKYVPNLYNNVIRIMLKEKLDFLKFSFTEFYGDNSTQWAWYNVPQEIRTKYWPDYDTLPEHGVDPRAPKTQFNHIHIIDGVPYITGEVYYSNWPQIVSRDGNKKMFLETLWARPYEQTWMSHMFQLTKNDKLHAGVLLASPITHNRFDFYDGSLRKES